MVSVFYILYNEYGRRSSSVCRFFSSLFRSRGFSEFTMKSRAAVNDQQNRIAGIRSHRHDTLPGVVDGDKLVNNLHPSAFFSPFSLLYIIPAIETRVICKKSFPYILVSKKSQKNRLCCDRQKRLIGGGREIRTLDLSHVKRML